MRTYCNVEKSFITPLKIPLDSMSNDVQKNEHRINTNRSKVKFLCLCSQ